MGRTDPKYIIEVELYKKKGVCRWGSVSQNVSEILSMILPGIKMTHQFIRDFLSFKLR